MVVVCGYDLYRRARRGETRLSWPMVATGTSLILLATVRFILNAAYIFLAFIRHDTRAERIAFFRDLHQPIFIARHVIFLMVQFIGDSFVVRPVFSRATHCSLLQLSDLSVLGSVGERLPCRHHSPDTDCSRQRYVFMFSLASNALGSRPSARPLVIKWR